VALARQANGRTIIAVKPLKTTDSCEKSKDHQHSERSAAGLRRRDLSRKMTSGSVQNRTEI